MNTHIDTTAAQSGARAAAEALPQINRRRFLLNTAVAGAAVAVAAPVVAETASLTPQKQIEFHLRELKRLLDETFGPSWGIFAAGVTDDGKSSVIAFHFDDADIHDPRGLIGPKMAFGKPMEVDAA